MPDLTTILAAAALAIVPSLAYLVILNAIDRYEPEPWSILISCIAAGALIAPLLSVAVFAVMGRGATLPPAFAPGLRPDPFTGIVEEVLVGIVLLVIVRTVRDEFDDILDGVIYGAAIGAGFGAAESFLYALGGLELLTRGTILQLVIAGLNHAFYAAVIGAVVGWAKGHQGIRHWYAVALGIATAALLHAFHDTLPAIMSHVLGQPSAAVGAASRLIANAVNWLGLVMIIVVVVWAWGREARILRAELYNEVKDGVVPADDYATITSFGGRLRREWGLLRRVGIGGSERLRRRYAAEGELAFHKWHRMVRDQRAPDLAKGEALRAEIRGLADSAQEPAR